MASVAEIVASLSLDKSGFSSGIRAAQSEAKGFGDMAGRLGSQLAGIFAIGAIIRFVVSQGEAAEQILNTSRALGLQADEYQALSKTAEQSNSSQEAITFGVGRLLKSLGDAKRGVKEQRDALLALGVTQEQIANGDTRGAIDAIAKAWSESAGNAETYSSVQRVLGEGATQLQATFEQISQKGVRGLTTELKSLGEVMDNDVLATLSKLESIREKLVSKASTAVGSLLGVFLGGISQAAYYAGSGGQFDESMFGYESAQAVPKSVRDNHKKQIEAQRLAEIESTRIKASEEADKLVLRAAELQRQAARERMSATERVAALEREIAALRQQENSPNRLEAAQASLRIVELERDVVAARRDVTRAEEESAKHRAATAGAMADARAGAMSRLQAVFSGSMSQASAYDSNIAAAGMRSYVEQVRAGRATHAAGAADLVKRTNQILEQLRADVATIRQNQKSEFIR